MQYQGIQDEAPQGLSDEQIDSAVLGLMLAGESWPWSVPEIADELGSETNAVDGVGRLQRAGLLHRQGQLVFPTRAARRAAELEVGTV